MRAHMSVIHVLHFSDGQRDLDTHSGPDKDDGNNHPSRGCGSLVCLMCGGHCVETLGGDSINLGRSHSYFDYRNFNCNKPCQKHRSST